MESVKVDPAYLGKLLGYLNNTQDHLDIAFGVPTSDDGGYPDKLASSHGYTSSAGNGAIMGALLNERLDAQKRLNECLADCIRAVRRAYTLYTQTDEMSAGVLKQQMKTGD
jgi:hypothetical protein